jgi:tetratricopeptide (TPR) repeat protein
VAQRQGHYDDARARAEEFRACSDDESWYHVTRGLYLCGWLAYEQGAYPAARERLRRVRGLAASAGDREYEALALEALGMVAVAEGRYAEAREYSEEALSQVRTVRQLHMVGPLGALGLLAATQGDHAGAERLLAEGLARARRLGDVYILARMLNRVGMASAALGDAAAARAAFQEALERSWLTGMPWPMAAALEGLAELDARHGDPERAARLLGAAEALRANVGSTQPPFSRDGCERALSQIKAALGEDGCDKALAEGRAMGLDEVVAIAGLCCMEAGLVTG